MAPGQHHSVERADVIYVKWYGVVKRRRCGVNAKNIKDASHVVHRQELTRCTLDQSKAYGLPTLLMYKITNFIDKKSGRTEPADLVSTPFH